MANQEHVAKLKEGVTAWNEWRAQNPEIVPDFSGFDFSESEQWRGTPVWNEGKWFRHVDLQRVNFQHAKLNDANLSFANLTRASLIESDLRRAVLSKADLDEALLENADIREAVFTSAIVSQCLVTGVRYTRSGLVDRCLGIRGADSCHGSPEFRRDLLDQDFIDARRQKWRSNLIARVFLLWPWAFFDYGRGWFRVALLAVLLITLFGFGYAASNHAHILFEAKGPTVDKPFYPWFVASMGFATLGITDLAKPLDGWGQALMMGNVLSGFVTLGLLLSVLGNSFARRA